MMRFLFLIAPEIDIDTGQQICSFNIAQILTPGSKYAPLILHKY